MADNIATFGTVLRQLRTAAALSQEALAVRAGLSLRGISDLERGVRRTPHLTTLRMLADALNLDPAARQALLAAARLQDGPDSPEVTVSPLPSPLTPLIGRERQLAAVISLLTSAEARLVTLTGTGGIGKTRLALEVGVRLQDRFADGVVFVDLAPLVDPNLVVFTIASALGVRERFGQRVGDTLSSFLGGKQMLLIIDNFEQVLPAGAELGALLRANPRLVVLTTSRVALRVRGERDVSLPPLPLPSSADPSTAEALAGVPAVALFVERAAGHCPGFALTPNNAADIAAICRSLDGLPLAIELAAARISVLPPAALLDRLEERLPLLTGGSRDLPVRQRTMRDTIAWSYGLLGGEEQRLFRQLAVFVGGWILDAAEAVSSDRSGIVVLDGLQALVDANLVMVTEQSDRERRFGILETIREFGLEQLRGSGEADEVRRRHAQYYVTLAETGGVELAAAVPGKWLARLDAEQANLRAAMTWLRDSRETAAGLRLAGALGGFWRLHNISTEGRQWLEAFLAQSVDADAPTADRIPALRWAGEFAGLEGDVGTAEARLSESLALARAAGDKRGTAGALGALGSVLFQHVDFKRSAELFEEAAALTRELGDLRQTAFLLAYLGGTVGILGELERGETLVAESQDLLRSIDDTSSFEADFLMLIQGLLALQTGDYERAEERLAAGLTLGEVLGAKGNLSVIHVFLAEVALARGDVATAAHHQREGLILGWEVGFAVGIALNLRGLVWFGTRRGEFARAARFAGALDAVGTSVHQVMGIVANTYETDLATVRASLGEEAFAAAVAAGRTRPLGKTIAEALAFADELSGVQH